MKGHLLVLLALAGGSVSAKCVMTDGDLKSLADKSAAEARAFVEAPARACSLTVNQIILQNDRLSRQPPIRQGQKWATDTVIVNVQYVQKNPGGRVLDLVSEAVLHECPAGVAECPVNVRFREGRQFFGGHYRIEPQDVTLFDTLARVAEQDGRQFVWDAGPSLLTEMPIREIPYFRPDALGVAVSGLGAFEEVLKWQAQ